MPDKRSPSANICLEAENGVTLDLYTISEMFKKIFSNLANDLVQKLPAAANQFGDKSVEDVIMICLNFQAIQTRYISDLLKN